MVETIEILTLTTAGLNWLERSRHPRVLHVFAGVCNLINEVDEVLSIVSPEIGQGPFTAVCGRTIEFHLRISQDNPASLERERLYIGDLLFNWENANYWEPRPDWDAFRSEQLISGLSFADFPVMREGRRSSLSNYILPTAFGRDPRTRVRVARRLAGLGLGLTPTGDDYLMGAMYAIWSTQAPGIAGQACREMLQVAAPRTNRLSAAWLAAASRGEAAAPWHALVKALIAGEKQRLNSALELILNTGHSSGADALAGFVQGLKVLAPRQVMI